MAFSFENTFIEGLIVIKPDVFGDSRGFFIESYKKSSFIENGINEEFVQDNHSLSSKGVLRGLHFQKEPFAQGKLVRTIKGSVWDVAVDLREGSHSFGKWFGLELSEVNNMMLYIPPGFAHGFLTLQNNTHFLYKCTNYYAPDYDSGIKWDDPVLGVNWPVSEDMVVQVSEKDNSLKSFEEGKTI